MAVSTEIPTAVTPFPAKSIPALLLLLAMISWGPAAASAQGAYPEDSGTPLWLAVNAGAGASVPLPLSSPMKVGPAAMTWNAGVAAHFSNMTALALRLSGKEFSGKESLYDYVKYFSASARGYLPLLKSPHFDILLVGEAGMSNVQKRYVDPVRDATGKIRYDYDDITGKLAPVGKQVSTNLWAPTAGLGAKLVLYPVDFVGIYVEPVAAMAWFPDFSINEGAATLDTTAGVEIHF